MPDLGKLPEVSTQQTSALHSFHSYTPIVPSHAVTSLHFITYHHYYYIHLIFFILAPYHTTHTHTPSSTIHHPTCDSSTSPTAKPSPIAERSTPSLRHCPCLVCESSPDYILNRHLRLLLRRLQYIPTYSCTLSPQSPTSSHFSTKKHTSAMDCFQDFCLSCDRDSPDGAYCSQQCKLADLERSNPSSPIEPKSPTQERIRSPTYYHHHQSSSSSSSSSSASSSYTYSAPSNSTRPRSSYFMWPTNQHEHVDQRQLTPSSSRSSLASTASASSITPGSYHRDAKAQLHDFFSSFEQAKAAKRRSSLR